MMEYMRPGWHLSINSGDAEQHHLRFYINARAKREDATQIVWRLSLLNGITREYEFCWLNQQEVKAVLSLRNEGAQFDKAMYYLRYCNKRVKTGVSNVDATTR